MKRGRALHARVRADSAHAHAQHVAPTWGEQPQLSPRNAEALTRLTERRGKILTRRQRRAHATKLATPVPLTVRTRADRGGGVIDAVGRPAETGKRSSAESDRR